MRRSTIQLLCLAGVAIGSLSSFRADESAQEPQDHDHVAAQEPPPHSRAPRGVQLVIHEGAWLRAPGEEWFARQKELDADRWSWVEDLAGGEAGWVDAQNVYRLRYDEEEDIAVYWQWVSAAQLTRGRQDFVQFCASCHGLEGDGYGRSGQWLRPSPRSFLQSYFKFTKTTQDLPSDAALLRLVKRGLDGTPMLPWDLSDEQLTDILQYVKSLSPEGEGWRDPFKQIGDIVDAGQDPWKGKEGHAIKTGERVYHDVAQCMSCHPGYVSPKKLPALREEPAGTTYREQLYLPVLKESNYTVLGKPVKILPPDFTFHQLRAGTTRLDLYETIAAGIKGTAMPQWKGSLPDEDIWALAYYVESLIESYKDKPAARGSFMQSLREGL
jgi:mono/diheme cytochrome c family protein